MIKAVIFDFDGVILESSDIKTVAFRKLFEKEFPEHVDRIVDYHTAHMGVSRFTKFREIYKTILKQPLTAEAEQELGNRFKALVFETVLAVPYVAGAMEFIKRNFQNLDLFIASGTPHEELIEIVSRRGLSVYFKGVFGTPPEKGLNIERILREKSYRKEEVLYVGDAESDMKASTEAGVRFIARLAGYNPALEKCEFRISDLFELENYLKQSEVNYGK